MYKYMELFHQLLLNQSLHLGQALAEVFAGLDAGRTDQHGAADIVHALDLIQDRFPLVLFRREDQVVVVNARDRPVGRHDETDD